MSKTWWLSSKLMYWNISEPRENWRSIDLFIISFKEEI
jgi:hypothetical protein